LSSSSTKRLVAIGVSAIVIVGILYGTGTYNTCGIRHINVINDLQKYENSLDPEFCEDLVFKIIELDEDCNIDIEILDCG